MKEIELLLVNSYAPRQRIASDAALENGLAILRTYLESQGYQTEVVDDQRVTAMTSGVPQFCLKLLSYMVSLQMKAYNRQAKFLWLLIMLLTWPLQALSLYYRRQFMSKRIDEIVRRIKENKIKFLGIKVWYGDAFTWSKLLAAKVRENCPDTVIIAGGPQVKVYGEHILADGDFDIAIMGPGEEVLEELLMLRQKNKGKREFINAFHNDYPSKLVKSGGYSTGCTDKMEKFITPRYRPEDLAGKILFHTLVDGYGCSWNQCSFCSHTRQNRVYQSRSIKEIVDEIEVMVEQGISFFRFSSSETPVNHGRKIAEEILKRGLNIHFSMFVRAVRVTPAAYEAFRLMIKAGLRAVFMGGETGHDQINEKIMNKGVKSKDIIDTINCIKLAATETNHNCRVGLSLIYPCPVTDGITLDEVFQENIRLIQAANPDTVIVNPPGVFPETKWMEKADEYGFSIEPNVIPSFMRYEYSIYKPVELWDKLGYKLQGLGGAELLKETGRFRAAVVKLGIPTDISDEYLMMTEAIGYTTRLDLLQFKSKSLQDIMSGNTTYMEQIIEKINQKSRQMALQGRIKE
ncbi:B12-binding domain-containing radical SAM protein [Anaerospora hongkongensis]|uniref:B12-binding domain-containing radical SAM protein n=1 Tax=Anaerospora hongkongensis TaxID=244830 RepID=UPI0028A09859|nr:radical SAM protein [Anaerospora hongkongensis]